MMTSPLISWPHEQVARLLVDTFDAPASTYYSHAVGHRLEQRRWPPEHFVDHFDEAADWAERHAPTEHPLLRYYLASAWYSVAEQCRARTGDDVLVITSHQQLQICEDAATRILALRTGDDELTRGAEQLLAEVTAGRRWTWAPEGIAVSLAVLTVALGLITVVAGGLMSNVLLVVIGVVIGAGLLFAIVHRFRRQTWRRRADQLAQQIVKTGV